MNTQGSVNASNGLAEALIRLRLRWPHMLEDIFSHGSHVRGRKERSKEANVIDFGQVAPQLETKLTNDNKNKRSAKTSSIEEVQRLAP